MGRDSFSNSILLIYYNQNSRKKPRWLPNFGKVCVTSNETINTVSPQIVSSLEKRNVDEFAKFATTIWNLLWSTNSKKNSCPDDYSWKYSTIISHIVSALEYISPLNSPWIVSAANNSVY